MKRILILILSIFITILSIAQSPSQKRSLMVQSVVQKSPPSITLNWSTYSTATNYSIFRKLKSSNTWTTLVTNVSGTSTQYVDNSISPGVYYEYKVLRNSSVGTAYGYVATGIDILQNEYRGKMILLVDNTVSSPLVNELKQLENDLISDGWNVIRQNVSRSASPTDIRTLIQNIYNSDPNNVKGVYLFGHIPVYYSGNIAPDQHAAIKWSCDSYYSEMNSTWSTTQTSLPSDAELQVGRVDLSKMTAFPDSEVELLRKYLNKSHQFKTKQYTPPNKGLISDNLHWANEPRAEGPYRTMGSLLGVTKTSTNLSIVPYYGGPQYWDRVDEGFLWTWFGGGGTYNSADGIGTSSNFVTNPHNGIFNTGFGSYFGNWDGNVAVPNWNNGENNFLRAPLASGRALVNCYDGQPTWYFHHMGMGDNIGYSTLVSLNNKGASSIYLPQNNSSSGNAFTTIHLSLMGDPSLRLYYVEPPSNFTVSNVGGKFSFQWRASNDDVVGYYLYEILDNGVIEKAHVNLITSTSYLSPAVYVANKKFMVRSVKNQISPTGSYLNLSLGEIATSPEVISNYVSVNIKAFLKGSIRSNNNIGDDLRKNGLLPISSPYSISSTRNETTNSSVLSISGSKAIVDWVVVELRNSPTNIVAIRSGLLRVDGKIVDMDGESNLQFDVPIGQYYVVVDHRNHLGVMTKSSVNLSQNSPLIDFTSPLTETYGSESQAIINGIGYLWSGDVNADGVVKYTGSNNDRDAILNRIGGNVPTTILKGYYSEDVNLDGSVIYTGRNNDRDLILVNIGGNSPTNVKTQQVPNAVVSRSKSIR